MSAPCIDLSSTVSVHTCQEEAFSSKCSDTSLTTHVTATTRFISFVPPPAGPRNQDGDDGVQDFDDAER